MLIKIKNWVYSSLILFRRSVRQSLFLGMLYFTFSLFFTPILVVSIGEIKLSPANIILPFIALIYMHFYRELDANKDFDLKYIFGVLKTKFKPLLSLGILSFINVALVIFVFHSDAGLTLEEIKSFSQDTERLLHTLIKIILISLPFLMATWFSPLLIAYNGYGFVRAVKSSLAGTLMFAIPLLLGWVILIGGFIFISLLVIVFFSSLSFLGQNIISLLSSLFLLLSFTTYLSILFIFRYVTYKAIFEISLPIKSK
jgi:hypothetical protein